MTLQRSIRPASTGLLGIAAAAAILAQPVAALSEPVNMTQAVALRKAIAILKGNPYGKTEAQVRKHIVGLALVFPGSQAKGLCEEIRAPVWCSM